MAAQEANVKFTKMSKMSFTGFLVVYSVIAFAKVCQCLGDNPVITYDVLYNAGIEAYSDDRWEDCTHYLTSALEDYKLYKDNTAACRIKCEFSKPNSEPDEALNFLELIFFETALRRSDCIRRCIEERLPGRPESINENIESQFKDLQLYDYLQICAFKVGDLETATAAAYTYLVAHPNHDVMKNNVKYYRSLPDVTEDMFVNKELQKYQVEYMSGVDAYGRQDYAATVVHMEGALAAYYEAYRRCAVLCEGAYDHLSLPDLYNAIADHYISVLRCRRRCPSQLATINGAEVNDYLAEHYNYLQFSYYREGSLPIAASCAVTYLTFKPQDATMKNNVAFYRTMTGVSEGDLVTRQEAAQYESAQRRERDMMTFIETQYKYSAADQDLGYGTTTTEDEQRTETEDSHNVDYTNVDPMTRPQNRPIRYFSYDNKSSLAYGNRGDDHVTRLQEYLNGRGYKLREARHEGFILDGLLSEIRCREMRSLAENEAPRDEDTKTSVDGLSVQDVGQLLMSGTISRDLAETFFEVGDEIVSVITQYYNLTWPLFAERMTIGCTQPGTDDTSEFTSPFHADSCELRTSGECKPGPRSQYWNDFSASLFLNAEFQGGDLAYGTSPENVTARVSPLCGRLVVHNASAPYTQTAITGAPCCVLRVSATFDPTHKQDQVNARATINVNRKLSETPDLASFTSSQNINIVLTEAELNGPQRFLAENVLDRESCDGLIHLANVGGEAGSGYSKGGLSTVDTVNERFAGLTVSRAAESVGQKGDGYRNSHGSPHTENEMFEGVTVLRAAQLAANNEVSSSLVQLYMEKSNLIKDLTAKYFNLHQPLYFDYTHLVCRTSLHDKNKVRTDLSHPVHSDNCIIQPDNSCKKAPPAYTQRDFSALLYLNENFTGGDFFFAHQNLSIQSTVRPSCGHAVGFYAGNYHGVQAVTSGQRCALACWFTLDKRYDEAAHFKARDILQSLDGRARGPEVDGHSHGEL